MNALIGKSTAVLLSSAALFASGAWIGHRLTHDHYQGVIARQALRFATERQKLQGAAAKVQIDADRRVLSAERRKEKEFAHIDRQHQQELQHAKAQNTRTLAQLDTARRLYIGIRPAPSRCNRLPATPSTAGVNHDSATAELSATSARLLVQLAFEADQAVRQLSACQKVIEADRQGG